MLAEREVRQQATEHKEVLFWSCEPDAEALQSLERMHREGDTG